MSQKIEVLLLKPLPPKGNAGDIIEVKAHYAQHVLIPNGRAIPYTKQVENQRAAQMKKIARNKADILASVQDMIVQVEKKGGITFTKAVTETGGLYDSITSKSLTQWVEDNYGVKLSSSTFTFEKVEEIGEYEATFTYEEISTTFPIRVIAETTEQ